MCVCLCVRSGRSWELNANSSTSAFNSSSTCIISFSDASKSSDLNLVVHYFTATEIINLLTYYLAYETHLLYSSPQNSDETNICFHISCLREIGRKRRPPLGPICTPNLHPLQLRYPFNYLSDAGNLVMYRMQFCRSNRSPQ